MVHMQEPSAFANILMGGFAASPTSARPVSSIWIASIFASSDGGAVSTVIENLLSRKQKLVEQLEKAQSVEDRDKIEHQLEQINTALDFLDRPESKDAR
jgi:predicted CopG family antitoxin